MNVPLRLRDFGPLDLNRRILREDAARRIAQQCPYSSAAVYDVLAVCADNEDHAQSILRVAAESGVSGALGQILDVLDPERELRR